MRIEEAENAQTPDEAAMVAAAQQDSTAFGPLYERYVDQIYRYAYRRVGNHTDAEDVTAQTFQQALAALPSYEWRGAPFGAWLYRIASNLINRRGRAGNREIVVDDIDHYSDIQQQSRAHVPGTAEDDPATMMARAASSQELLALVQQLPPDQQRAIVLKFSRGLKSREIADVMGRSEGAVKQLVHRAILALRASLEDVEHV